MFIRIFSPTFYDNMLRDSRVGISSPDSVFRFPLDGFESFYEELRFSGILLPNTSGCGFTIILC